jgi:hypothetical protein
MTLRSRSTKKEEKKEGLQKSKKISHCFVGNFESSSARGGSSDPFEYKQKFSGNQKSSDDRITSMISGPDTPGFMQGIEVVK